MAKHSRSKKPDSLWIKIDIEEVLAHYAFGERWRPQEASPAVDEFLAIILWGTVVGPKEKAGRDIEVTITGSEGFTEPWRNLTVSERLPIGELLWAAQRVARVQVPPGSMWRLVSNLSAGHFKRMELSVDTPLRGNVVVRDMHLLTHELRLAMLDKREVAC